MSWRQSLVKAWGPGLLGGITFGDWLSLLRDNRWSVAPAFGPRAAAITFHSLLNSVHRWREQRRYGAHLAAVTVPPPLFLLGHWRNGTTHLHNLLSVDERFAFPNNYQTLYPHTFLLTERFAAPLIGRFLPPRRPMDNVEWTIGSPQEDEFALLLLSLESPYLSWVFPQRREYYNRFLTFRQATADQVARWQRALQAFLVKLTFKHGRPLVLKSPGHTARIKLLLEMFPAARFVHIRRNPYEVFPSFRKTIQVNLQWHQLQRAFDNDLDDHVLRQYRELYDAYFEQRPLIPPGRLCEVAFEDLERDPIGQLRGIYGALDLPDFNVVAPALERYVTTIAGYRRNEFPPLPVETKRCIAGHWQRCFDEWGYAV